MHSPSLRTYGLLPGEIVVDSFAGGGGASAGISEALGGRHADIAINHSAEAIAMYMANHPGTKCYQCDVWEVDPKTACGNRPVGIFWMSPSCTHFSRAKGTQPVHNEVRGLADVGLWWGREVAPRQVYLENVTEFLGWGPLLEDAPRPDKARAGESFRAFVAAWIDLGYEVQWRVLVAADYGTPTIRKRLFMVMRNDGMPIVWPAPTHGKGRAYAWVPASTIIDWSLPTRSIFDRPKPMAEATMKRIAIGIKRYVIEAKNPFIVPTSDGETAGSFVVRHGHYSTKTGAGFVEGAGAGTFRGQQLSLPLGTICTTEDKHIVLPMITKYYGGVIGHDVNRPLGTVTTVDHHALSVAFCTKYYGTSIGSSLTDPLPTVTSTGSHLGAVQALLIKYYGASGGASDQDIRSPLHTVTTKDRFALVEVHGHRYQIADIRTRMFKPGELFRAMGFGPKHKLNVQFRGKPLTQTALTKLAGNAVCPQLSQALVSSNLYQTELAVAA